MQLSMPCNINIRSSILIPYKSCVGPAMQSSRLLTVCGSRLWGSGLTSMTTWWTISSLPRPGPMMMVSKRSSQCLMAPSDLSKFFCFLSSANWRGHQKHDPQCKSIANAGGIAMRACECIQPVVGHAAASSPYALDASNTDITCQELTHAMQSTTQCIFMSSYFRHEQ